MQCLVFGFKNVWRRLIIRLLLVFMMKMVKFILKQRKLFVDLGLVLFKNVRFFNLINCFEIRKKKWFNSKVGLFVVLGFVVCSCGCCFFFIFVCLVLLFVLVWFLGMFGGVYVCLWLCVCCGGVGMVCVCGWGWECVFGRCVGCWLQRLVSELVGGGFVFIECVLSVFFFFGCWLQCGEGVLVCGQVSVYFIMVVSGGCVW